MMRRWYREITRQPKWVLMASDGLQRCCYCGEVLCVPGPELDLQQVALGHYATAWRKHARLTEARQRV